MAREERLPGVFLIADVHLGNLEPFGGPRVCGLNERCRMIFGALKQATDAARLAGCIRVISLGDFFDTHAPSPQLVAAAQRLVLESKLEWIFLLGNHEKASDASGDNALAPLAPVARVVEGCEAILHGPTDAKIGLVAHGREIPPEFRDVDLLCLHRGIDDGNGPGWQHGAEGSISLRALDGHKAVAAGDWHARRWWPERNVLQVGAFVPRSFAEDGDVHYGWAAIWNGRRFTEAVRVPGPRFVRVPAGTAPEATEAVVRGLVLGGRIPFVEVVVSPDEMGTAPEVIAAMKALGAAGCRVVPAQVERSADVVSRAIASTTAIVAVEQEIKAIALPRSLTVEEVRDEALARLAKAR